MNENNQTQSLSPNPITLSGLAADKVTVFFSQVYMWMTVALLVTAGVAYFVSSTSLWLVIASNSLFFWGIILFQFGLVIGISSMWHRMNVVLAGLLFLLYSVLNGLLFGFLVFVYTEASIFVAFGATAGTFMIMSAYAMITKEDLTKIGNLALMGLVGLIVGGLINLFVRSDALTIFFTFLGILIFIILIAYDTQKLKNMITNAEMQGKMSSLAINGALMLYLDFVNLFLKLLQLFGKRR